MINKYLDKKNLIIFLASAVIILSAIIFFQFNQGGATISGFNKDINKLEKQSSSTEIKDIENDLNNTDLTDIDKELTDIDNELNSF